MAGKDDAHTDAVRPLPLRSNFEAWIERGRNDQGKELRALLRDDMDVLLDTGARPADELLNL
jgi:hypothetical protein